VPIKFGIAVKPSNTANVSRFIIHTGEATVVLIYVRFNDLSLS